LRAVRIDGLKKDLRAILADEAPVVASSRGGKLAGSATRPTPSVATVHKNINGLVLLLFQEILICHGGNDVVNMNHSEE
jgi:hypothetical protein